jgi:hypothetical protein
MKKHLLALMAILLAISPVFAQKLELSVQANSNLFHFSGNSAVGNSMVIQGNTASNPTVDKMSYTNNPYGNKNGFGYGGSVQGQFVTKSGFIVGMQAGYEFLRSQVDINTYIPYSSEYLLANSLYATAAYTVKGHTSLQNQTININPYIGYRLHLSKVKLDILPGMDIGLTLKTTDKGSVKDNNGNVYPVNRELSKAPTDVRLRLGAVASYGRYGLNASYAHGVTNYLSGIVSTSGSNSGDGSTFSAHSELFRLGLSYRVY